MAKVIGRSGYSATNSSIRSIKQMALIFAAGLAAMAFITGYLSCLAWEVHRIRTEVLVTVVLFCGIGGYWLERWASRTINDCKQQLLNWRKGNVGQATVASILESLPDNYVIFNDLRTLSGKVDHLVIGPTGIFVIETKNWHGVVTPDGRGELLCNGRSTGRDEIRHLLSTINSLHEKINVLTHRNDFIQGILAFPLARIESRWGATRNVHCLDDQKIPEYIQTYGFSQRLRPAQIELIEKAVHAVAGIDRGLDPADGGLTVLPARKA